MLALITELTLQLTRGGCCQCIHPMCHEHLVQLFLGAVQSSNCGFSWVTSSWFLDRDIAVELFKCSFSYFEHHKPSALFERSRTSLWTEYTKTNGHFRVDNWQLVSTVKSTNVFICVVIISRDCKIFNKTMVRPIWRVCCTYFTHCVALQASLTSTRQRHAHCKLDSTQAVVSFNLWPNM